MNRDVSSVRIWLGIAALTLVLAFLLSYRSIKQNETSDSWLDETLAMPGEDGYSLVRSLRAQSVRQPIAALTAQARDSDRARAMESGCDMHIRKPIEARALGQAVAALASAKPDSGVS